MESVEFSGRPRSPLGLWQTQPTSTKAIAQHPLPPESLSELVPKYLEQVPTDWFDGQSVRYRTNGNGGFVLYSVGRNGKDDGGNAEPPKKDHFRNVMAGRDFVWPAAVIEAR